MDRPTLQRAIASAAAQTWPNLEIVVIVACGSHHKPLVPTDRPIRLIYPEPDRSLSRPEAANLVLDSARGEWLNFLDDDDELLPGHVSTLVSATGASTERLRYSRTETCDPGSVKTGYTGSRSFHVQLYYQARCTIHSALFHRSLVEECARFDPAFLLMEDRDSLVSCASRTPFGFVDATTCIWHAHIGESGMGHGANADPAIRERYLPMLHAKWEHLFNEWRSQLQGLLFYGQHLIRENPPEEALQCLEQAVRIAPRDINALNLCGMANLHAGNPTRAEQLMRQAVALLPGNAHLRENLELIREALDALNKEQRGV